MRRIIPLILILSAASTTLHAQAPIERRTPPPSLSTWPTNIPPRTRLLLNTSSGPYSCRLRSIDATQITCAGQHHTPDTTFNRADVVTITDAPQEKLWPRLGLGIFKIPLIVAGIGLGCVILGGGAVCAGISLAGFAASGVLVFALPIINQISDAQHRAYRTKLLYIAPPQPTSTTTAS